MRSVPSKRGGVFDLLSRRIEREMNPPIDSGGLRRCGILPPTLPCCNRFRPES